MTSFLHSIGRNITSKLYPKKTLPLLNHRCSVNYADASHSTTATEEAILPPVNEEEVLSEEDLERKRDISRLKPLYRNVLYGKSSIPEPTNDKQRSLKVQRILYAKFGNNSGVNPAICFITEAEIEDIEEYEKVANSEPILEIRRRKLEELAEQKRQCIIREKEYDRILATTNAHKERLREKILKKLDEAQQAKKKREELLEEVKRHFGYSIDPNDEKFQLMVEQKEKEQKKLRKEMKKKKREEYFMAKLAALESGQETTPNEKSKKIDKKENLSKEEESDDENDGDKKE